MCVCEQISQTLILSRPFRLSVLEVLVRVHQSVADPEYVSICQALQFLNRAKEVRVSFDPKKGRRGMNRGAHEGRSCKEKGGEGR